MTFEQVLAKATEYRKGIAAFIAPALPTIALALADGVITGQEWLLIVGSMLGIGGLVTALPNALRGTTTTVTTPPLPAADEVPSEGLDEAQTGN